MALTEEKITELDQSNIKQHIFDLGKQISEINEKAKHISFFKYPKDFQNVILLGTGGGSSIASKLTKALLEDKIDIPIVINQGYSVPKWVSDKTLAIAITVSGNTEETIEAYQQCLDQKAFCVALTSGGKLKDFAEQRKSSVVNIPSTEMQARSAIGHLFVSLLHILKSVKILKDDFSDDLLKSVELLNKKAEKYNTLSSSKALKVAKKLKGFTPVIYSSDELMEVASIRWKNQFGENSKVISHWYTFPELNHDEIVGWDQDEKLQKHFKLVFLRDEEDHPRIKTRMDITKELLEKRGVEVIEVKSEGKSKMERALSAIYMGDWVSIYLAFLYDIDPTPVDLIIEMKEKLVVLSDEV